MSTFYDTFQTVAAAWEMNERIIHHCQPAGLLAGLKYDKEGIYKIDGEDDLPLLQPWSISFMENLFAGAPSIATSGDKQANQPTSESLTLSFRFASSRKNGWFRRDPTNTSSKKGMLEWLSLIRDAIETDKEGMTDSRLKRGLVKPILYSIGDSVTTELSFQCYLEVRLDVWPTYRAERRLNRSMP
jgi:hypothetical protein